MKISQVSLLACALALAAAPVAAQDERVYSSSGYGSSGGGATYTETRLTAQEEQLRQLNGRIEQIEFAVRRMEQSVQRMQSDVDTRLTHMEQVQSAAQAAAAAAPAPVAQPAVATSPSAAVAAANAAVDPRGSLGGLKVQNGKVTGGINNPQATPLPTAPADYGLTPAEQYDRALGLLKQANYPEAEQAFKSYIDKNPKDKLIDNAKYWYGETLYVRARFDEAAVAFADAYQQNTQGTKATDSLLKLAMSLGALNKIPDACVTLNELKSKYPNASQTIKAHADAERARMKCPAR